MGGGLKKRAGGALEFHVVKGGHINESACARVEGISRERLGHARPRSVRGNAWICCSEFAYEEGDTSEMLA